MELLPGMIVIFSALATIPSMVNSIDCVVCSSPYECGSNSTRPQKCNSSIVKNTMLKLQVFTNLHQQAASDQFACINYIAEFNNSIAAQISGCLYNSFNLCQDFVNDTSHKCQFCDRTDGCSAAQRPATGLTVAVVFATMIAMAGVLTW